MLNNLNIRNKLLLGFGVIVGLTLLMVSFSFLASTTAITTINRTGDVRVPAMLASSRARADLLRMLGDMHSYLVLGDQQYLESYQQSERSFEADLEDLAALSHEFDAENQQRLERLTTAFEQWQTLPPDLFALRDDQMEREPAYAWINTSGAIHISAILTEMRQVIDEQSRRDPSLENNQILSDMAEFQNSTTTLFAALRGYVTTRKDNFRFYEYEANRDINENAWNDLLRNKQTLTPSQQEHIETIAQHRAAFLDNVPSEVFTAMESDQWRGDLYLFRTEVAPLSEEMQQLLEAMSTSQQQALLADLNQGRHALDIARWRIVGGGGIALLAGIILSLIVSRQIANPVIRLTNVAERIQAGEMDARAPVESGDEIGKLAHTFNTMTEQLQASQAQLEAINLDQQTIIQAQEATLIELSTPLIPITDQIVAMPLIGYIDSQRAQQVMASLLQGVQQQRARIAILDMTGIPLVDTQVADALIRTVQAVRLVGAQVIITGIRPEIADTLVRLGVDLSSFVTRRTLQNGITYALKQRQRQYHTRPG